MSDLHHYGLARFSQKTGRIDTVMTALGKGVIQLWALQNTTKAKACVICDIEERRIVSEYIGTADGFPQVIKDGSADAFLFGIPDALFDEFAANVK